MTHDTTPAPDDQFMDGEPIAIAKQTYILPPLPLRHMTKIAVVFNGGDPTANPEYVEAFIDGIYFSLRRNYPGFDREYLADNIDLLNFPVLSAAFRKVNGMVAKESAATGEVTAG